MRQGWSVFRAAVALLALASMASAQDVTRPGWDDSGSQGRPAAPGRDGVPTIRTGVQLVVQDITVTDAQGHPVTGLKPEDFHIFEDGREQAVKNFEEHAPIDPALAQERADALAHSLPPNTFTNYKAFKTDHTVVFLLNLPMGGCPHVSEGLTAYMKTVPPGTPFIVLWLDGSLRMVQDMTTDRDALMAAAFDNSKHVGGAPPAGPDDPRYPSWTKSVAHRQIVTTAMNRLERYLGGIPGKKDLVWFTAGINSQLATIDDLDAIQAIPTDLSFNDKLEEVYSNPNVNPDLFNQKILPDPKEMKSHPTVSSYIADIRSQLAQSRVSLKIYQGGCNVLAPVQEQVAAIVDRASHYYTLTYSPTNQNWNGRPRVFRAELADPKLRLEYRKSYVGSAGDTTVQRVPAPAVQTAASETVLHEAAGASISMQTAMGMGTVEPTQVVFEASATRAAAETKDSGKAANDGGNFLLAKYRKQGYRDYTAHFRVRANELKLVPDAENTSYFGKLEFVAVVYDNQGQAVNGKREKASVSFPNLSDPQLQAAELTGDLTIQVPAKGSYFLRLGVHDMATDRVGALEIPVDRIPVPTK